MPGWVDTPEKERAWKKAKHIVSQQREKAEGSFTDRDWGLVTHIAKNILSSSMRDLPPEQTHFLLAKVEFLLEARRKEDKKTKNADLPDDVKELVEALSSVMAVGGQTIAALRGSKKTGVETEEAKALASDLQKMAVTITKLLEKVKG